MQFLLASLARYEDADVPENIILRRTDVRIDTFPGIETEP